MKWLASGQRGKVDGRTGLSPLRTQEDLPSESEDRLNELHHSGDQALHVVARPGGEPQEGESNPPCRRKGPSWAGPYRNCPGDRLQAVSSPRRQAFCRRVSERARLSAPPSFSSRRESTSQA